jgi:hypothetical protein
MLLTEARITSYKSIDDSGPVPIDKDITVLVGQNESGKTAFLQGLYKAAPIDKTAVYEITEEFPRKGLTEYEKRHASNPAVIALLTYELSDDEVEEINESLGAHIIDSLSFTRTVKYGGPATITLNVPEKKYVEHRIDQTKLSSEVKKETLKRQTLADLISFLDSADLNTEEQAFLSDLKQMFGKIPSGWGMLNHYVWSNFLSPNLPKFLYFDDYYLLPGKVNLPLLQQRINDEKTLSDEDKTVISLLRMAGVDLNTLTDSSGYEQIKARLEAFSNSITDKVFEYWTQNQELDVEFDIRADPRDLPPFNDGNNLYIRIRNRRHRVTVPFSQRSKGFIWFFSFLVWFGNIQEEVEEGQTLILLLDEPGLSLHALAQADLLRYIDALAEYHQILYTTHSPFMVRSDRLHQVRTVEDLPRDGTKVSDNVSGSDPKTIFPLQAALGYTIAQNLFISKRNLLVEGPADLVYLKFFSALLDQAGRTSLRDDITIVPTGGLDNVATFVALLQGNELEMAVVHDLGKTPPARLENLIRDKLIRDRQVLSYAAFRNAGAKAPASAKLLPSDVEDLISPALYLRLFNNTYTKELNGKEIKESDLSPGDRIVERINRYLDEEAITLRPSGGFNHYLVANYLASHPLPISRIDAPTLKRFETLFESVNRLYSVS